MFLFFFRKLFFIIFFFFLQYSVYAFAEIQIPQSQIEKVFSSFSDPKKYEFKAGAQLFSGFANSSIGIHANIYNNMTDNFAPMIGADFRYHLFHFDNKISNFTKTIDGENFAFDIKTNNILDFSMKFGMRFKINKNISLTPYGIIGFSWNKVVLDNSNIKPIKTVENTDFKEAYGLKMMTIEGFSKFLDGVKAINDSGYPYYTKENRELEIFFLNHKYNIDINGGVNFVNPEGPRNALYQGDEDYVYITYGYDSLNNVFFTDNFEYNGDIKDKQEIIDLIKAKLKESGSDMIIIKSSPYDSKAVNQLIEPDIYADEHMPLISQKTVKDDIKIYERITKDANGNFTMEYLDEQHVLLPKKAKYAKISKDANGKAIIEYEQHVLLPKEVEKPNLLSLKYGAGIELDFNNIFITLEYRHSRPNVGILYSNFSTQNYKIDIHEINFGFGWRFGG